MIEVYGYLGEPTGDVRRAVAGAGLVAASVRALDALGVPAERRVVLGRVAPAIEALTAYERAGAPHGPAVALASGDPLFYGVVRRFRAGGLECRVHAGVSSVAAAFAAVGVPWDDAQVVSAHGHGLAPTWAAARALPKVAVLTAPGQGVAEIAGGLRDVPRWYVVAERLGESDQRVRVFEGADAVCVADVVEPNVVLVLAAPPDAPEVLGSPTPYVGGPRALDIFSCRGTRVCQAIQGGQGASGDRVTQQAGRHDGAVALALGRYVPVLGQTVWTAGAVAERVAAWCARTGAAVVDLDDLPGDGLIDPPAQRDVVGAMAEQGEGEAAGAWALPAYLAPPDLVLLDDPAWLPAVARHGARLVVLLAADEAAEAAAAAVDEAGFGAGARIGVEHLALTAEDGATNTTYLTTIDLATIEIPREDA